MRKLDQRTPLVNMNVKWIETRDRIQKVSQVRRSAPRAAIGHTHIHTHTHEHGRADALERQRCRQGMRGCRAAAPTAPRGGGAGQRSERRTAVLD